MSIFSYIIKIGRYKLILVSLLLSGVFLASSVMALTAAQSTGKGDAKKEKTAETSALKKAPPVGPVDEFERGTPRSSLKGFFKAARSGDFEQAAEYLDLHSLPSRTDVRQGEDLARQLKIVLDRTLMVDVDSVSANPEGNKEDGLPEREENVGRIKTPTQTFNILLRQVPRDDGVYVWKFSNRTVAEIPALYRQFGYRPFEERLSRFFPDITFLGWQIWQWFLFLVFVGFSYLAALLPTWLIGAILRKKDRQMRYRLASFITKPVRIVLMFALLHIGINLIGPSTTLRSFTRAETLFTIAVVWAMLSFAELLFDWWAERLRRGGQEAIMVLRRPIKNFLKIVIVILAALFWLENLGFNVSTLLTGLGVGGLAVALAAQDTLKNFIASVMIILDTPYRVGQRIVVKGHDGVVEEIGLRSTRLRLLNGHQATIPNDEMARSDIENIGRRPHIRRLTNLSLAYDTPPEKVEKAVAIINKILENHVGMDPDLPPKVYFDEFNLSSLNILVAIWYHPPEYWEFLDFSQRVNLQIIHEFTKEGIKFALPSTTTYLAQDEEKPLQINISESGTSETESVAR
ncbi:transporter, small conductance mechanosensitive ion channel (MscS) family protein [delta proteobacterium NaphS2]|nr:transporter, small conductance mechanosensitive ion channel (MscS) family protein [delta proteobacterium NaphS2]